jgi:CheY-like chemotaxis protein
MPRMNGLEAARKLRALSVKAPIILFTMYADILPPEAMIEAGISAVVSKTDLPALQHRIEELLVAH